MSSVATGTSESDCLSLVVSSESASSAQILPAHHNEGRKEGRLSFLSMVYSLRPETGNETTRSLLGFLEVTKSLLVGEPFQGDKGGLRLSFAVFDSRVPPFCLFATPFLPNCHIRKHNLADRVTKHIEVNKPLRQTTVVTLYIPNTYMRPH